MNGENVFVLSDSIIRNMKRALVPLSIYQSGKKDMKVLFIDGNQKFFKNPVIGYYKESICLDIIPESIVDYKSLPVSGRIKYVPESEDLLFYLKNSDTRGKDTGVKVK